MVTIKIGGRKIPLLFNLRSWMQMEKEICVLARVDEILRYKAEERTCNNLSEIVSLTRIFGNEGLKQNGQEPELTDEWLIEHIRPNQVAAIRIALMGVMGEGFASEQLKRDENAERDLVLEEINKKKRETADAAHL